MSKGRAHEVEQLLTVSEKVARPGSDASSLDSMHVLLSAALPSASHECVICKCLEQAAFENPGIIFIFAHGICWLNDSGLSALSITVFDSNAWNWGIGNHLVILGKRTGCEKESCAELLTLIWCSGVSALLGRPWCRAGCMHWWPSLVDPLAWLSQEESQTQVPSDLAWRPIFLSWGWAGPWI